MKPVQSVEPLKINIGGQLADHEIVGRELAIESIVEYLARGMNLLINDPRRIGKSAVLQLLESASTKEINIIKTSVQGIHSQERLLLRILDELHDHESFGRRVAKRVGRFIDTTGVGVELGGLEYAISLKRQHANKPTLTLLGEVVSAINDELNDDELLVLAIDEFTEAVVNIANGEDGVQQATQLLQILQTLRKEQPRVRWVLTGSIGIHHAIRRTNCTASVVADGKNVPIGPLSLEAAQHLSRRLAAGESVELTDDAHAHLAETVNGIPILVHAILDDLRLQATDGAFDVDDVEDAINPYIGNRDESRAFEHFVTRLADYYSRDELKAARALLDSTATSPKPKRVTKLIERTAEKLDVEEEFVRDVLVMLQDDHYLVAAPENGRVSWRYSILARIWRAKRGL